MKTMTNAGIIVACLTVICGCQGALKGAFVSEAETDQYLVNYARPENGTKISASEDNPDHSVSTLTNGITSSENWNSGEGWEVHFDGAYEYGRYTGVGENAWAAERLMLQANQRAILRGERVNPRPQIDPGDFEDDDYRSRGLTRLGAFGGSVPSAMGWVVFEFPEEKLVTRVVIHTVDSANYPANQYGVSDLVVQYWAPQAKGWNHVDRQNKKVGQQHNSIRDNKKGRISVRFKPVRTSGIRVVVRWTNDSETYRKTRYYRYVRGTVRITEVEIYGLEKKDEVTSGTPPQAEADEQMIDEIFAREPTYSPSEAESSPPAEELPPVGAVPAADAQPKIERVIRAYASAYDSRDVPALMATISPSYSRGNEDYQHLQHKMDELFQKYTQIDFALQRLRIQPATDTASAEADYTVTLTADDGSPMALSGKLFFELVESEDGWQISRIDTQR